MVIGGVGVKDESNKRKEAHITLHQWSPKVPTEPSSETCGVMKKRR